MKFHVGLDWKARQLAYLAPAYSSVVGLKQLPDSGKRRVPYEETGRLLGEWLREEYGRWQVLTFDYPEFWIENPFAGYLPGGKRNIRTAIDQALTVGGVLALAPGDIHLVEQSVWKKELVGRGNAGKDDVAVWLAEHHPALSAACAGTQDLVDAACLGLYGSRLAGTG